MTASFYSVRSPFKSLGSTAFDLVTGGVVVVVVVVVVPLVVTYLAACSSRTNLLYASTEKGMMNKSEFKVSDVCPGP